MDQDEIEFTFNASLFFGSSINWTMPWTFDNFPDLSLGIRSQTVLVLLYSLTAILTLVGNLVVLLVLGCSPRLLTDLNRYLINLAVADLCMATFCIPFTFTKTMLGRWVFGEVMCPLVLFMQVLSVAVSIFTNTAIGIDRFVAVVYPLKRRLPLPRVWLVICSTWIFGTALASVQLVVGRERAFYYAGQKYHTCSERWDNPEMRNIYTAALLLLTYLLPLCILSVTYYKVGAVLWQRRAPGNAEETRDRKQISSKKKVTKMLVILVVAFGVCWLPLHVFTFVIDLAPELLDIRTAAQERLFFVVFYSCHWLAMANSVSNPIIYCFLNERFQKDLRLLVWRRCCRDQERLRLYAASSHAIHYRAHSSSSGSGTISIGAGGLQARSVRCHFVR